MREEQQSFESLSSSQWSIYDLISYNVYFRAMHAIRRKIEGDTFESPASYLAIFKLVQVSLATPVHTAVESSYIFVREKVYADIKAQYR